MQDFQYLNGGHCITIPVKMMDVVVGKTYGKRLRQAYPNMMKKILPPKIKRFRQKTREFGRTNLYS